MGINIGEKLRRSRRLLGVTQKEVYEKLGVAQSTYSSWEIGKAEPNLETIIKVCEMLNISLDEFLNVRTSEHLKTTLRPDESMMIESYRHLDSHGKDVVNTLLLLEQSRIGNSRGIEKLETGEKIPFRVYTQKASAGFGNYLCDDSEFDVIKLDAELVPQKAQFGIRISGVSMEPKISDGQIVFVEPTVKLENNDIGIFIYEGEAFCKKLRIDYEKEEISLVSLNENYADIKIFDPESLRTVGKVVGQMSV